MLFGHLGQTVDIGLAGAKIAALDGVIEQAEDGVAVALIVLGRIDAALGGDGMRTAWAVLDAETLDLIAQFGQSGGGGGAGQTAADNDDFVFPLVGRVDEFARKTACIPFFGQRSFRNFGIKLHSRIS